MEIKNIVESAATVTHVQTLHKGDIYKRVEADNGDATIILGRVMAVASNGEQTVVRVIEATRCGWSTPNIRSTAFTGDKGVIVFPLDGPELSLISSQMFRDLDSAERDARKSLALIIEKRGMLRSLITPNDNDDKENH